MFQSKPNLCILYSFWAIAVKMLNNGKNWLNITSFRDTEANFNNICNINNQINYRCILNETNPRFVAIKAKTS